MTRNDKFYFIWLGNEAAEIGFFPDTEEGRESLWAEINAICKSVDCWKHIPFFEVREFIPSENTAHNVTEDIIREGYEAAYFDREDRIVGLISLPETRSERAANKAEDARAA